MRERLGRLFLRALGWRTQGTFPDGCDRCVLVAAPHTSNLDLFFLLAFAMAFGLRVQWVGKHTLFRFPMGLAMRFLGGIPVDRRSRRDSVAQLAAEFTSREKLVLVIAPEGTRSHTGAWKSGFYWIARTADVPIVPSFLDWGTKTAGFGPAVWPSESLRDDMDKLRSVYDGKRGRHAGRNGPIWLPEEDRPPARAAGSRPR